MEEQQVKLPIVGILIPYSMEVNLVPCLESINIQDYPAVSIVIVNTMEAEPKLELTNQVSVKNVVQGLFKRIPTNIVNLPNELNDDACNTVINDIVRKISIVGVLSPLYEYVDKDIISKNVVHFMDFPQQLTATYADYKDSRRTHYNKIGENFFVAGGALKQVESLHNLQDKMKKLSELYIVHHIAECHTRLIQGS